MKHALVVIIGLLFFSCKNQDKKELTAQFIVDNAIKASGTDLISTSKLAFDFRDKHYKAKRLGGDFQLERMFQHSTLDSVSNIRDVLNNQGFQRFVGDLVIELQDSMIPRYAASVNSVHYFSVLPYGLNDKAVNKVRLDDISIFDKNYHTIKISFNQDGGGEDFEDEFIYWINVNTYMVDYLAYSYNESDGKGIRFREAYNERFIDGIRFVDYNNYKSEDIVIGLTQLPQLFQEGTLKLLSKIELENVSVDLIDR